MKTNTTKEIKDKMLSVEQVDAVIKMIIKSMRESYLQSGIIPGLNFESASFKIAKSVVDDVQKILMESSVYNKIASSKKPLKVNKKKNARK